MMEETTRKVDNFSPPVYKNTTPLDFIDIDPNYHVLKECFPEISSDDLIDALEYSDGDLNLASEYLISGKAGKNSSDEEDAVGTIDPESEEIKLCLLMEMFPHIEVDVLSKTLKETNYDSDKATEQLLNHDVIQDFENKLEIQEEVVTKNENSTWASINDRILEIMELTQIDTKLAKTYYNKNGRKLAYTLVDIIYSQRKEEEKRKKSIERAKAKVKALPRGGRVQTNNKPNLNAYDSLAKLKIKDDSADDEINEYVYNENNPEVSELTSLINHDPILIELSWEFYEKSLIHFKGDAARVMRLALFLAELPGGTRATYRDEEYIKKLQNSEVLDNNGNGGGSIIGTGFEEKFKPVLNNPKFTTPMKPVIEDKMTAQQYTLRRTQLKKCKEDNILDLHHFHVGNAKKTTMLALEEWWTDELIAREKNGNAHGVGGKAREVDPFIVVTGKGIHSEGGISKVRHSVKALLDRSKYRYLEETAKFVVIGLK